MDEMNNFGVYGGYAYEVYGVYDDPVNNIWDETIYDSSPPEYGSYVYEWSYLNQDVNAYNWVYYQDPNYMIYYPDTYVQDYSPYYTYFPYYVYLPVYSYYYVANFDYSLPASTTNVSTDIDAPSFFESHVISCDDNEGNGSYTDVYDSSTEIVGEEQTICYPYYEEYPEKYNTAPVEDEGKRCYTDVYDNYREIVGEEEMTCYLYYEEYPKKSNTANVEDEGESGLENNSLSNIPTPNEVNDVQLADSEPSCSFDTDVYDEEVDENIVKKISLLSIEEVKEDIDDNYENGKAFLYNQVLKGYLENKSTLEELEWECHSLDDILEEEEPETDSSEMDLNKNVLEDLENDSKRNYLVGVLDEPDPTCTLICEVVQEVLSEECVALNYKMKIESSQISVSSSYSLEDPAPDTPGISTHNEEFDCVAEISDNPTPSMASQEKIDDPFPDRPETSLSKELDCVSQENIEGPPPFLAARDRIQDEVPGTPEISPTKEFGTVSLEIITDPPPSFVSRDRMEDRVPDTPAITPSNELDSVSQEIIESPHPSTGSRGRIEENEQLLVPDMLEPLSAAASQTGERKKRFSSLRKFFARICCCIKKPPK